MNIPAISLLMRQDHLAEVSAELRTLRFEQETESTRQKLLKSLADSQLSSPVRLGAAETQVSFVN